MGSSHTTVPHIHNTAGLAAIRVGTKTLMCIGTLPPLDHPHVFLNMGDEKSVICPYCSTYFLFDSDLSAGDCSPHHCLWEPTKSVASSQNTSTSERKGKSA